MSLRNKSPHQEMLDSVNDAFFQEQIKQVKGSKKLLFTSLLFLAFWVCSALVSLTVVGLVIYILFQVAMSF